MKSLQVITLGCSKNTVDTERLLARLDGVYNLIPESRPEPVDVLLVNTCGFIGDAKEESIQAVLEAANRKKAGEVGKLIVFGCLSQRYMAQLPDLIPEVDGWFGAPATAVSGLTRRHIPTSKSLKDATGDAPIAPSLSLGARTSRFLWKIL